MDKEVNLELWDLPGRDNFIVLNRMYLRDTNAALIVYDVNDADSLKSAEVWISELQQNAPSECVWALCGNKMDTDG
jgi:GTPase SAR1 family protein